MNKLIKLGNIGMLLSLLLPLAVSGGPLVVKLTVKHDGKEVPSPAQITLTFNGRSAVVPVQSGKFEVPPGALEARRVTFTADVGDDRIRIYVSGEKLTMEDWTLSVTERHYEDKYQWLIPKGSKIPASCILAFESIRVDPGVVTFAPHCRSKRN
jgi:hypothetical protein